MELYEDRYADKPLQLFVETLINEHYNTTEKLCASAKKQTEKISSLEIGESMSQYTLACNSIITETEQYIRARKEKYIPYMLTLSQKADTQHDCSTCTGSCKLNHDMQLLELRASNELMQKTLKKLQIASLPLYSETIYADEYRLLRSQMAMIETSLSELFFLENNYLIPKIQEAQKNINAGNY